MMYKSLMQFKCNEKNNKYEIVLCKSNYSNVYCIFTHEKDRCKLITQDEDYELIKNYFKRIVKANMGV